MKLIERYIFRRVAQVTFVTLAAATIVVMITQVLIYVNVLTDSGQAIVTFLRLAAMLVPAMVVVVMPFALLIGASQTFSGMNADSELAVIESAGGSPAITTKPVIVLGMLLSLTSLGIALFVEPWSNRQIRDIVTEAGADLVRFAIQSGSFKRLDDKLYIQIAEQLPGGTFSGVFIADERDKAAELIYYAKRGAIVEHGDNELLVMSDGEIQRRNAQTGEISIIRFASYAIDFSQFGPAGRSTTYFPKERSTAYLLDPDPNDMFTKRRPQTIRAEINRRFSEWMFPLAFALIATYFAGSARSNRQERIWALSTAVIVAIGFRGFGFFAINNSGSSQVFATLSYTTPLTAIFLFAWLIATGRQLRMPQRLVDRTGSLLVGLERRRTAFHLWIRGYRHRAAGGGG